MRILSRQVIYRFAWGGVVLAMAVAVGFVSWSEWTRWEQARQSLLDRRLDDFWKRPQDYSKGDVEQIRRTLLSEWDRSGERRLDSRCLHFMENVRADESRTMLFALFDRCSETDWRSAPLILRGWSLLHRHPETLTADERERLFHRTIRWILAGEAGLQAALVGLEKTPEGIGPNAVVITPDGYWPSDFQARWEVKERRRNYAIREDWTRQMHSLTTTTHRLHHFLGKLAESHPPLADAWSSACQSALLEAEERAALTRWLRDGPSVPIPGPDELFYNYGYKDVDAFLRMPDVSN